MFCFYFALVFLIFVEISHAKCNGTTNHLGKGLGVKTFVKNVTNGELYTVSIEHNTPPLLVATVRA
jgi:hypothetical protein